MVNDAQKASRLVSQLVNDLGFQTASQLVAAIAAHAAESDPHPQYTTEAEAQTIAAAAAAAVVASSPAALDTLAELAAALGNDANFATSVTNALAGKLNSASYTAADVLAKLLTVDGSGSGLDADTLRGTTPSATGLAALAAASPIAGANALRATPAMLAKLTDGTGYAIPFIVTHSTTTAAIANRSYYFPVFLPGGVTVNQIAWRITTNSGNPGGDIRVGFHAVRPSDGMPGAVLHDAGVMAFSSGAVAAEITRTVSYTPASDVIVWGRIAFGAAVTQGFGGQVSYWMLPGFVNTPTGALVSNDASGTPAFSDNPTILRAGVAGPYFTARLAS